MYPVREANGTRVLSQALVVIWSSWDRVSGNPTLEDHKVQCDMIHVPPLVYIFISYMPSGGRTGVVSGCQLRLHCLSLLLPTLLQSVLRLVPPLSVKLLIMARFVSSSALA